VNPATAGRALVFDTMVLSAFAEADRLDVLGNMLAGDVCYMTDVVRSEIQDGAQTRPALAVVEDAEWLQRGDLTTDQELIAFVQWVGRVGSTEHGRDEASVFAFAEVHNVIAITDDRTAKAVARTYGLSVHGSLWLIAGFCAAGKLSEHAAGGLIDGLAAVGLRLPCTGSRFPAWAHANGLL